MNDVPEPLWGRVSKIGISLIFFLILIAVFKPGWRDWAHKTILPDHYAKMKASEESTVIGAPPLARKAENITDADRVIIDGLANKMERGGYKNNAVSIPPVPLETISPSPPGK